MRLSCKVSGFVALTLTAFSLQVLPAQALPSGAPVLSTNIPNAANPVVMKGGTNFDVSWPVPSSGGVQETGYPTITLDGGAPPSSATTDAPGYLDANWHEYFSAGLTPGSHTLTVSFAGDSNFAAGSSSLGFNVGKYDAPVIAQPCNFSAPDCPYAVTAGKPFVLSASTWSTHSFAPLPMTGTVDAYDQGTLLASMPITYNAGYDYVTSNVTLTTVGSHTVTLQYSGDSNYSSGQVGVELLTVSSQYGANHGYRIISADGSTYNSTNTTNFGNTTKPNLNQPVVGAASTADGKGYWQVASDGGIFSYGDAAFYGSTGSIKLNKPVVGMASTPDSKGYWLVASDGGIFAYGDANFYGSTGSITLNKPVVGMTATPDGNGYWLVASDGGIFAYGDAAFYGSTGSIKLNKPVVGMASTPSGNGYWFVASDGGIFSYGDAAFAGSRGSAPGAPVVGMLSSDDGQGYMLAASDGGVFNYGDSAFHGSARTSNAVALVPGA